MDGPMETWRDGWTKKQSNRKTDISNWNNIFYLAALSCSAPKWGLRTTVITSGKHAKGSTQAPHHHQAFFPQAAGSASQESRLEASTRSALPVNPWPPFKSSVLPALWIRCQLVISRSLEHTTLRAGAPKEVGWRLGPPPLKNCQ